MFTCMCDAGYTGTECELGNYLQTSNVRRTLVNNEIVDHSDVVDATPTTSE